MTDPKLKAFLESEFRREPPQTAEDHCRIAARAAVRHGSRPPRTEAEFLIGARGLAEGLLGTTVGDSADYAQRVIWIDMCEVALRAAAEELERGQA
jgi:hypothetical protein